MKGTLANMIELGGRNTEKDIWGHWGGYPFQKYVSTSVSELWAGNCPGNLSGRNDLLLSGVSAIGNIKIFNFGLWKKQYQLIPVSVSAAENV